MSKRIKKPTLNPVLKDFWDTRARNRVLYGGRSSSKSWDAAGRAIAISRFARAKFLCTRQYQNRIEESVYSLLKLQIERFNLLDEYDILQNKIRHKWTGSEFIFYGLWRHIDEIKSLEGVDICWIEEAHALKQDQWRILRDTIRKEGSEFWVIFNPRFKKDFVFQNFVVNPPKNTIVRKINYDENPFLSDTMLEIIDEVKERDIDEYRHVYLGEALEDDDAVFIKEKWLRACIDAHNKLNIDVSGARVIGFDVADSGEDKNAIAITYGSLLKNTEEWSAGEDELLKSCSRVFNRALETESEIVYDCIGVGASSGAKFAELNESMKKVVKFRKFNAGAGVVNANKEATHKIKNKDLFKNAKAQAWWHVAERAKNTYNAVKKKQSFEVGDMLFFDKGCKNLNKVISELSTPRKEFIGDGKIKVESKDDLKKRGIASPNLADAVICAYAPRNNKTAGVVVL